MTVHFKRQRRALRRYQDTVDHVSLTGHQSQSTSPVRRWFAHRLPNTPAVVRRANHALRAAPLPATTVARGRVRAVSLPRDTPPLPFRGADPQLVGTALDLLARVTLRPHALRGSQIEVGAGRLGIARGIPPAVLIANEAMSRIDSLRPYAAPHEVNWQELSRLVLVLGRFEQAGRSEQATIAVRALIRDADQTLEGYDAALVHADDVTDIALAGPAIASDLSDLHHTTLHLGPTFALSRALRGADGDLISNGTLLDLKASATRSPINRAAVWQLVGYALADLDDVYSINTVGVCALRWRTRCVWDLHSLLNELAGEATSVAALRDELVAITQRDQLRARQTASPARGLRRVTLPQPQPSNTPARTRRRDH
jgi:hypothetical protein